MRPSSPRPFLRPRLAALACSLLAFPAGMDPVRAQCETRFRRGDSDGVGGVNLTDAFVIFDHLFLGSRSFACLDAVDANDDSEVDLSDGVFILAFLFIGGPAFPAPGAECGLDLTPDGLSCEAYPDCFVPPDPEVCDGLDNDCDGEIDEGFDLSSDLGNCGACGSSCAALELAHVAEYACIDGRCAIARCEEGFFDVDGAVESGCEVDFPANGAPCDDGNPCTDNDMYFAGICGGTRRDCSSIDDQCNTGACDLDTGECVPVPRPEGTICDDGNPRTAADHCDRAGECGGVQIP